MHLKLPFHNKYLISLSLSAIALLIVLAVGALFSNEFQEWELKTLDYRFRLRQGVPMSPAFINIGIDDRSLDALGAWPWDRSLHARMIALLQRMGASVISLDLMFPRPSGSASDQQFIDAARNAGNVVLSTSFILVKSHCFSPEEYADFLAASPGLQHSLRRVESRDENGRICIDLDGMPQAESDLLDDAQFQELLNRDPFVYTGDDDRRRTAALLERFRVPYSLTAPGHLWLANRAIAPIEGLTQAAAGMGHIAAIPDSDGVFRRVALAIDAQKQLFPSLALASVLKYLNVAPEDVIITPGKSILLRNATDPNTRERFDIDIPVDDQLQMLINYPENQIGYSFSDVLEAENDPEKFADWQQDVQGRICLIGYFSTGTGDIGPIPLQTSYFLAYIHSAILNTILTRNFLREVGWPVNLAITATLLVLISILFSKLSPMRFTLVVMLIIIAYLALANQAFQSSGAILAIFHPALTALLSAYSLIILYWYATEERERKYLRSAFKTYVSKQMLDQILDNPGSLALTGKRKEISIMFSDVRKFSTLSDKIEPEVIHRLLNMYFSRMTNIAFKYDGFVDKFIGDGLLCFFGDPIARPDHAMRAVSAAIDMQKAVRELGPELQEKLGLEPIVIRIGINTGYVIVGNMGSAERMEYTVLGSEVNLAQRLEASATPGEIMISDHTYQQVKSFVETRDMGDIHVKGFEKAVKVYEIQLPFE